MVTAVFDNAQFDSMDDYRVKKERIQQQFFERMQQQETLQLEKEASNLFRHRRIDRPRLDVRCLNKVISVDADGLVAEVEGMTTYADLVDATLAFHCMPAVVPELKSITIGGALSGIGIESSSFRYGLVHETIEEFEVLLGDGRVVIANSYNAYRDLFFAFPNSYGTLGYALKIKVKLIPVKPYVKLTHHHFTDSYHFFKKLNTLCLQQQDHGGKIDFIDGVVFGKHSMVISTAHFVDQAPHISNYRYMKVYYRSLLKHHQDFLTTYDYLWRWDADWFWCSKFFGMQNGLLRLLFGKWMLKSRVYWKFMQKAHNNAFLKRCVDLLSKRSESVIQDVAIPIERAENFLHFFQQSIGIKPVWVCPVRAFKKDVSYNLFPMNAENLYVNFGFWDTVPSNKPAGYFNRLIEDKVEQLCGRKSLYSNAYYTEEQFWKIYDKPLYQQLKQTYDPNHLLSDIYSKCTEKN